MNFRETIEYLYRLRLFGTKLGLEHTHRLAEALGTPQAKLRFVHVAGTNGKGSVCTFLETVLLQAGYKVGTFTSPHLVQFGERIRVLGRPMPQEDLIRWVAEVRKTCDGLPESVRPTFFEFLTCLALRYFADQDCDIVIWETGMGGRLDATNIVDPECAVITNVSKDHQAWLGDTLEAIAREKAGIIKQGAPILTTEQTPEILEIIRSTAKHVEAPFTHVCEDDLPKDIVPGLPGPHQRLNAALAFQVITSLQAAFPVTRKTLLNGLQTAQLAGRFQIIQTKERIAVLDVAHNLAGYACLAKTWKERFGETRCHLIFGSLNDKPWKQGLEMLAPLCHSIHCVPALSQRSESPATMQAYLKDSCASRIPVRIHEDFRLALKAVDAMDRAPVLITGSFYLIGAALAALDPSQPSEAVSLNEWGARLGA